MNATTEFDRLMKCAFQILFAGGSANNYFTARSIDDCYSKPVKPDFILPDNTWIDFKLRLSYRESHNCAWQPSALYSSLRKYVDHVSNKKRNLLLYMVAYMVL